MRTITVIIASVAAIAALFFTFRSQPAAPAIATFPEHTASIVLGVAEARAALEQDETFHECRAKGCSADECSAATQNGFTCKGWRCFEGCFEGKGFSGACIFYPTEAERSACESAANSCMSRCRGK